MADPGSRKVLDLFEQALELEPDARKRHLDQACGHDGSVRAEVERLLAAQQRAAGFLSAPAAEVAAAGQRTESPDPALLGTSVGSFQIDRVLASGGMGVVFQARQQDPPRDVALKVMRRGIASRAALRRFRDEAAILDHLSGRY